MKALERRHEIARVAALAAEKEYALINKSHRLKSLAEFIAEAVVGALVSEFTS